MVDAASWLRVMRCAERVVPDFLIIGAQKSGTTFLMSALEQSRNFLMPALKEIHYFDINFRKSELWYRGLLPRQVDMSGRARELGSRTITGEASPYYMYYPHAAGRAHSIVPNAKIIAILRDPVERAISHYYHSKAWGFETLSIDEAFDAEESRLAPEKQRVASDPNYTSRTMGNFSYVDRGHYVGQLKNWEQYFTRNRMLILDSRSLFTAPQATLQDVCRFLEIPNFEYVGGANRNVTSGKVEVSDEFRQGLRNRFKDSNDELFEYTGIRF